MASGIFHALNFPAGGKFCSGDSPRDLDPEPHFPRQRLHQPLQAHLPLGLGLRLSPPGRFGSALPRASRLLTARHWPLTDWAGTVGTAYHYPLISARAACREKKGRALPSGHGLRQRPHSNPLFGITVSVGFLGAFAAASQTRHRPQSHCPLSRRFPQRSQKFMPLYVMASLRELSPPLRPELANPVQVEFERGGFRSQNGRSPRAPGMTLGFRMGPHRASLDRSGNCRRNCDRCPLVNPRRAAPQYRDL